MNKEEIISGMELIMHIASFYCHPNVPDVDDWGAVRSIAETSYEELNNDRNV